MKHIFAFGCPHSGTTYIWRLLERAGMAKNSEALEYPNPEDHMVNVRRITEAAPVHPVLSNDGLLGLAMVFIRDAVFVRMVRDPVEVFESFYAKRVKAHRAYMKGVNDDERIYEFIIKERQNVAHQIERHQQFRQGWRKKNKRGWPLNLVNVEYEKLDDDAYKQKVSRELDRFVPGIGKSVLADLRDSWKVKPIRHGRLQMGITETLLPDGMADDIRERVENEINP